MLHRTQALLQRTTAVAGSSWPRWLLAVSLLSGCVDNATPAGLQPWDGQAQVPGLTCLPDLDGQISAKELVAAIGVPARFRVATDAPVDLAGQAQPDGARLWDWSAPEPSDKLLEVQAIALQDRWYAGQFPTGQFALALDAAGSLEGVYAQDDQALRLLGMASRQEAPKEGKTLLVYTKPVDLYRFPLQAGQAWTVTGQVQKGTLYGLPYAGQDTYVVQVDGQGTLILPDLDLSPALRVRTTVTVAPVIGGKTTRRQVSLLFECLGEVARATAPQGTAQEDFPVAAELRRLGL